ncbi:MAG: cytochrome c maturation protein CcmE [Pseudomonadota bacterium]
MKAHRRQRLFTIGFLFLGAAAVVGFLLLALQENIDLFYPPADIVAGKAPVEKRIRAGGMVLEGSVERGADLAVAFVLTDRAGAEFTVRYRGILPDLFREGQGILATGELGADGVFVAQQVLAKHDEKYMPPELADMAANTDPELTAGEGSDG